MNTHAAAVFYDASGALCNAEISAIRKAAPPGVLEFIDVSAAGFDAREWLGAEDQSRDLMAALHLRESNGIWHRGVDAFVVLYDRAGIPAIARLWGHPLTRRLFERLYPWIARNRYGLSRFGLPAITARVIEASARGAATPITDGGAKP